MKRFVIPSLLLLVAGGLIDSVSAQSQVLFQEDFENGLGAWPTIFDWSLAEPGACGLGLTRTAKYGLPPCGYSGGFAQLISPGFSGPATGDMIVSMDVLWDMDTEVQEQLMTVTLENSYTAATALYVFQVPQKGVLQTITLPFSIQDVPHVDPWDLRLSTTTQDTGTEGKGFFIDNIRIVTNAAVDLGVVQPAGPAPSQLIWIGEFAPGSTNAFDALGLPPNSSALLVAGTVLQPAMAKGVLVNPAPLATWPLVTPPYSGTYFPVVSISYSLVCPDLPPGTQLCLQMITVDATGAWSASNTLVVVSS